MEWTAERIRLFREVGLCLSQEDFAKRLGFAKRTIGNAERGAHPPSLALLRALNEAAEQASAAQRERFVAALGADGHGAEVVASGVSPVAESVELLRQVEASELGPGTVEQLEELVGRLGVDYFAVAPAPFRATVLGWRRYVGRLLRGRVTLRERGTLYSVAGWLSGLVAEASLALGEQAGPHCATALVLARECGDRRLAAWVRGTQAQVALYAGDPREAVGFAQAGRLIAPPGSAPHVRVCALEMRAHARQGDLGETERALARAEQALDIRREPQDRSFFSFDTPYLPYYAGTAYVWLGKAARARTWAGQAIELCDRDPDPWPVARTSTRVDYAIALTQAGEREGATIAGAEAITIWAERPTFPARARIEELINVLYSGSEPYVVELRERWRWISR